MAPFSTIEFRLAIEKDLAALALSTFLYTVFPRGFRTVDHQVIRFSLRNRSRMITKTQDACHHPPPHPAPPHPPNPALFSPGTPPPSLITTGDCQGGCLCTTPPPPPPGSVESPGKPPRCTQHVASLIYGDLFRLACKARFLVTVTAQVPKKVYLPASPPFTTH